jgi:carbon storage regulator CsrA
MLVLSRKSRETVVVGGADGLNRLVTVTVLEIGAGKVRLGFEASDAVPVHRGEVWERLLAARAPPGSANGSPDVAGDWTPVRTTSDGAAADRATDRPTGRAGDEPAKEQQ